MDLPQNSTKKTKIKQNDLEKLIRKKLSENLEVDVSSIDNDFDLYGQGIIDSFDLANLIALIEEKTCLTPVIRPHRDIDEFKVSINRLCSLFDNNV